MTLLSTSPSTSMRPSSGLALSFQSDESEHPPRWITSSSLASAGVAVETAKPRARVAVVMRAVVRFMCPEEQVWRMSEMTYPETWRLVRPDGLPLSVKRLS
ncbi:MAG: hypothetical protein WKF82_04035 [Nocardioidaceae bacterium]